MPGTESVKVLVRVRPLSSDEKARGCLQVLQIDPSTAQVTALNPKTQTRTGFSFNAVFGPDTCQQEIYDQAVFGLVESVLEGYNGTIFAYGQTGCGKTFTMAGETGSPGVIPNSFKHLFGAMSDTDKSKCFLVRCSYMEIYNEEIRDLLHYDPTSRLELKEGKDQGIFIKGLTMATVASLTDMTHIMDAGSRHRTTKETMMNERSSRSHAIFTVYLEMSEELEGRTVIKAGKLNLVDLAGSERQNKTQAAGDRLREAIEINLSLSALGNVITALVDGKSAHIPYRDSKLTRLLQDSLGGNTKTIMIAVVSPADYNLEESLSTLRYASRARRIQNKPVVNEDPKDAMLRAYAEEIAKLKKMLADRPSGEPVVIEKIVERERVVEREVPVPYYPEKIAPVEDRKRAGREGGKMLQRTAKKVAVILEDDSEDEPIAPKRTQPASQSSFQAPEHDSLHSNNPPQQPKPALKATSTPQPVEDSYTLDDFEEESNATSPPKSSLSMKVSSRQVLGNAGSPVHHGKGVERPGSKEGPVLRPANEERKAGTRRIVSTEAREITRTLTIRSSRSPAVRRPLKGVKEESVAQLSPELESPSMDMLSYITEKLITGGQLIEETEQERLKEYHRLQLQLQGQKDKAAVFQETKRKQEEELLLKEKQYQSLAEEVEEQRKVTKGLRAKYQAALSEIEDLAQEREIEKADLLDLVRGKDRELAFYQKLVGQLVAPGEVPIIQQKSKYDEDNHDWLIPPFVVQHNKQIVFPKLQKKQAQEVMEKDLQTRAVVWGDRVDQEDQDSGGEDTLKKYQWLTSCEGRPLEMDNRPPTSGHRSRLVSRHSRNVLLEPLPADKAQSSLPCASETTPLSKKRALKPQPLDAGRPRKASDISVR